MRSIEEELAKLAPILGEERTERLWLLHQTETDFEKRRELEAAIHSLFYMHLGQDYKRDGNLLPPPEKPDRTGLHLGMVHYGDKGLFDYFLGKDDLLKHCAIFGATGAGKTNLALHLVRQFLEQNIPFMIFDWKRNYRDLLATETPNKETLLVYTVGRNFSPFSFNPFTPPPGTDQQTWDAKVIDVLCHSHFLGHGVRYWLATLLSAMEGRSTKALLNSILKTKAVGRRREWLDSALRAVGDLSQGPNGEVFGGQESIEINSLLSKPVIFELDGLSNDAKTFFTEVLLAWLHQYRLDKGERETLNHVLMIEEAHRILLRHTPYQEEESIVDRCFREIRELGEGIVFLDQHPSLIAKPALGNAGTTIVMRLKHHDDVKTASDILLLEAAERNAIGLLDPGWAVVSAPSAKRPFLVNIPKVEIKKGFVTDAMLKERNASYSKPMEVIPPPQKAIPDIPPLPHEEKEENNGSETLSNDEKMFLMDVVQYPHTGIVDRYARLRMSSRRGTKLKASLEEKELISQSRISTGNGSIVLIQVTPKGLDALASFDDGIPLKVHAGRLGGPEHRYWVNRISEELVEEGYNTAVEFPMDGGKTVDVVAEKGGSKMAVEIETGKSDVYSNVKKNLSADFDKVVVLSTSRNDREKLKKLLRPSDEKLE